jgi:O-antigen/teichoic acid export membrane protein
MINVYRFISNTSSSIIQTLISALLLLLLYRYLLVNLGSELLGLWSVLLASISITRLSDMGLGGAIVKFVARYQSFKDDLQIAEIIHTATISVAISMAFFCLVIYLLLDKLLILFIPITRLILVSQILPWLLVSFWLGSLANIFQSALDGCQRIYIRNTITLIGNTFFLIIGILGVSKAGIIGLVFAQLFQSSLLLILNWLAIRKYILCLRTMPFTWNKNKFKEMFNYAVNFQINSIALLLFDPVSKLLMSRYGGLSCAGYYEMASQIILRLRSVLVAAIQPLVPVVAELHETSAKKIRYLYCSFYKILFFVNFILYASILIFLPLISLMWLGYFEIKFLIFSIFLSIAWGLNSLTLPAYFFNLGTGDLA